MGLQAAQNFAALVIEQTALLPSGPLVLFIGWDYLAGCLGQILADMIEIQQIRALLAKVVTKFIHNPRSTVAQSVHLSFLIQTCFERYLSPHPGGRFSCSQR